MKHEFWSCDVVFMKTIAKLNILRFNQSHFSAELHCKMLMVNLDQLQSRGPATPCRNAFILCRNTGHPQYLQPSALLQFAIIFTGIHTSAFGLGTMVYIGLEFGSWFEIPWDSPCYQVHFWICVNIFVNIQIFLGCARSEPSSTNHFHLLPNVFCLHELSGNYN